MNDLNDSTPLDQLSDAYDLDVTDLVARQIAKLVKLCDIADKTTPHIERWRPAGVQRAGLDEKGIERAVALIAEVRRAEALLPTAEKLVELLHEIRLDRGHQLVLLFGEIAAQGSFGETDPRGNEILGPLAALLECQAFPVNKPAATP